VLQNLTILVPSLYNVYFSSKHSPSDPCWYWPVPVQYWSDADSIGPVLARYWPIMACLWAVGSSMLSHSHPRTEPRWRVAVSLHASTRYRREGSWSSTSIRAKLLCHSHCDTRISGAEDWGIFYQRHQTHHRSAQILKCFKSP